MNSTLGLLIFFGAGLSLLMAASGLGDRKLPRRQCLLYALAGALLLEFFLTHSLGFTADMRTHPLQTGGFLLIRCARYSVGPLFLAFYLGLTTYPQRSRPWLHYLPQGIAWALSLAYLASALMASPSFGALRLALGICTDLSQIHMIAYILMALLAARSAGNPRLLAAIQAVAAVTLLVAVLLALYGATGWKPLEMGSQGLLAAAMIAHFLHAQLRPGSLERFGQASRRKVYQRSALAGVDTELLAERLRDLMEQEKVYCDELLTLETLADRLAIPRNRLSEFLNGVLDTTFSAYVNGYRVEEAKRLLLEHPERSVLAQGMAAGFNSKSAFYDAFKRRTGRTPQEFRDKDSSPQQRSALT